MKTKIIVLFIFCFFAFQNFIFGQTNCGPATPTFTANLTGQPNGSWVSPVISRDDTCCGSTSPDKCVQFIITLDPAAQGILFNIFSGSVPPGAMYYQVNCGPQVEVGSAICLNGAGPHYLTFCKPGNNSNEYIITSLSTTGAVGDTLAMGCTGGTLSAWGYHEPSINWTSIYPGAQGAYDSYLNCPSGCDTVNITPLPSSPPYIDYQICGLKSALCDSFIVCDTVRIYIFSTLQVIVSASPILCNSSTTGSLSANSSGGAPPYSYAWSNGSNTKTISGLAPGNYSVNVTDANGCSISGSGVIVQPLPLVVVPSQSNALCFGAQNGTASLSVSGGTSPYTYFWPSCGCTANGLTGLAAGSYLSTVTDQNGCSVSQTIIISQPSLLTLNISSLTNVSCNGGNNGQASASVSGGTSPYTYLWNTNPSQANQTATGLSAGSYIVTVFDNNGCASNTAFTITEPSAIITSVKSSPAKCFGTNTGSVSVTVGGGIPSYAYLWSSAQETSAVSGLIAGNYSVIVTDANGCTAVNAVTISQPALLTSSVTVSPVSCYGGNNGAASVAVAGGSAPYSYLWSNGTMPSQLSNLLAQTYTVTITDSQGCKTVNTALVTQPNPILVTTSPADTICPGNTSVISVSAIGGTIPFTYFWQPNVGFGSAHTANPNVTTTYTAIITDSNGCTSTGTSTIVVYSNSVTVSLNATPAICVGQLATLSALVTGNNIASYSWSNNLGNGAGPFVVSPPLTTTYSVVVTSVCGAPFFSSATVIVHPLPVIELIPKTAIGCDRTAIQFSDTNSLNIGSTYNWNFGDGGHATSASPYHTYMQSGVYTVMVSILSPFGCSSSEQTTCIVTVYPTPNANFTSDPSLKTSIINPYFNFQDLSTNAKSWSWDFGDGQTSALQNPFHTYAQVGTYVVKLVTLNTGGCIDSILKTIEVQPESTFYIPNTFTPNGDYINDVFTGKGLEITEFEMRIFDRWGNKIFETNDLNNGWDGRASGGSEIAQQDVYVYQVKLRDFYGTEHVYTGHVNLVK